MLSYDFLLPLPNHLSWTESQMAQPVVSVIVPFWSAELFLEETIESVLAQSFQGWDPMLVDDGSTDSSLDIAVEHARKDPRVGTVTQENQGAAAARNAGIVESEGKGIAFPDNDDLWHPEKLARQIEALKPFDNSRILVGTLETYFGRRRSQVGVIGSLKPNPESIRSASEYPFLFLLCSRLVPSWRKFSFFGLRWVPQMILISMFVARGNRLNL